MPFPNFLEKLKEFPLVNSAFNSTAGVYNAVKESHSIVKSTLNTAEATVKASAFIAAPLTEKFKDNIEQVDKKMVEGLEMLEEKIPVVKDRPEEIVQKTKDYIAPKISTAILIASASGSGLKTSANNALKSSIGKYAMETLDITSAMTDRAMDVVIPPTEGEEQIHPHSNLYCEDKVYHVVHTVGTLGIKAGRKVSCVVSRCRQNRAASAPYPSRDHPMPADHHADLVEESSLQNNGEIRKNQ